jgi:transcriptional regulator with XRE-family HTH domain
MSNATDGHIDQLVKAGWLAIGLSQTDLAEVLGAAFQQNRKDGNGSNGIDAGRLMRVAEALDIPVASVHGPATGAGQEQRDFSSADTLNSLQSLLQLRLLRAFHEIEDQQTKRMLVHLAEKIVKRQANRRGDAG